MVEVNANAIQGDLFSIINARRGFFDTYGERLAVQNAPGWIDRFGKALFQWSAGLPRPISVLSLFSGAGGLDIAFHDCGFEETEMVEIDERFVTTLRENSGPGKYFPTARPLRQDICEYYPDLASKVDFIIGGPPCQTFSAGGRRAGGVPGTTQQRGNLFEEYVRLLKHLGPTGFLFENVYGITGAENGDAWEKIKSAFRDAGYQIFWRILDAADYGVPQHRERMFIVGVREGEFLFPRPTHGPDSPNQMPHFGAKAAVTGVALTAAESAATVSRRFGHLLAEIPPGLNYSFFTEEMGHPNPIFSWRSKFSDFLYKADPATPVRTIKAQGGQYTGPFHWDNRPFSLAEMKRLQTFPDEYQVVGGRQVGVHQIGNSVPPQLGRILALAILEQIFAVKLPAPLPTLGHNEQLGFRTRKRQLTSIYRKKARKAIGEASTVAKVTADSARAYSAVLTKDFRWIISDEGELQVQCAITKDLWTLKVSASGQFKRPAFKVEVAPAFGNTWALEDARVELTGHTLTAPVFTAAWKAFETEVQARGIKADLVQLSNYYQYAPRLKAELTLNGPAPWQWKSLQRLMRSDAIGKTLNVVDLASICQIETDQTLTFAIWLRSLGYEIRNSRTNPQIQENCFLMPYAFPTFSPMSVQLRKSLSLDHVEAQEAI